MPDGQKKWGAGRVAVLAQIDEIKAEISTGRPISQVYEDRKATLGDVGYSAFSRLVKRYAGDLGPKPASAVPSSTSKGKPSGKRKLNPPVKPR